ncbi:hypothetical protein ACOMICROBIO_FLGHMIGD_03007 [Vibrio sp. B1FLJ16]|nr:hypothetical protein ACOMICROBIO_FLGHMIGD_03007 [Vibrio sp. B1FLJ16]CAE6949225.1 hypothetical protein ACOMICROBIO_FLGHMIGD_03007 [Vibrio sp. B1FLJ16]
MVKHYTIHNSLNAGEVSYALIFLKEQRRDKCLACVSVFVKIARPLQ